jgi:hypothetical protein
MGLKILLVLAHPGKGSFNHAIAGTVGRTLVREQEVFGDPLETICPCRMPRYRRDEMKYQIAITIKIIAGIRPVSFLRLFA